MRRANGAVVTPPIGYTLLTSMVDVLSVVSGIHFAPIAFHQMFGGKALDLWSDLNGTEP